MEKLFQMVSSVGEKEGRAELIETLQAIAKVRGWNWEIHVPDVLVERHVAAVYVMIVNCWTSHGRRTFDDNVSIRLCWPNI